MPLPQDPKPTEPVETELKALRDPGTDVDLSDAVMGRIARMKKLAPWLLAGAFLAVVVWAVFLSELFTWGAKELGGP